MNNFKPHSLSAIALLVLIGLISSTPLFAQTLSAPSVHGKISLGVRRIKEGHGAAIAAGQIAVVQYTGWLFSDTSADHRGAQFDTSRTRGAPFSFHLGAGEVIKGWDQGVAGMKVGEQRVLVIPPELGYGATGAAGVIPPGATLLFEVELVGIQ